MAQIWYVWSHGQNVDYLLCHEVETVEHFESLGMRYSDMNE